MPNRIVREAINNSERVDRLSLHAEVFYRRLLNVVDDYGRFDARPSMLLAACYPLRAGKMLPDDVESALYECTKGEKPLVILYALEGKRFLEVQDFRQQIRSKASKYPDPPSTTGKSNTPDCAATATHVPSICTLYSESESESYTCASAAHAGLPPDVEQSGEITDAGEVDPAKDLSAAVLSDSDEARFDAFWKKYSTWRNRDKKRARAAFMRVVRTEALFEAVLAALDAQTPEMMERPADKRPYAETWINGERWKDQVEEDDPQNESKHRLMM
jgi:hypothetical protein